VQHKSKAKVGVVLLLFKAKYYVHTVKMNFQRNVGFEEFI